MLKQGTISVILPTYREKDSIREVVDSFFSTDLVDEVIVVDNNSEKGTLEAIQGSGAKVVHEKRQGYGYAIRAGLAASRMEYIVICEPDNTFVPGDIYKLLSYSNDFSYVIGTRTSPSLIWNGANMRGLLRWGNWAVAKFVEVLYNTSNLTDVGCTFRLFHRDVYTSLAPQITHCGGSDFGLILTLLVLRNHFSAIEIPVNYRARAGKSSVTGDFGKAVLLGIKMVMMVLYYRVVPCKRRTYP